MGIRDRGQIDQIALVAADKMILGKLLFGTLQAGACRELAFGSVVVQDVYKRQEYGYRGGQKAGEAPGAAGSSL